MFLRRARGRLARGRARVDGVPSEDEIRGLLAALSSARWRPVAELQLRLGLRRAEVLAIREEWIDEPSGCVLIRVGDGFDTKSHASRIVDGVDAETFALAREVLAMKASKPFSVSGYAMASKRACKRLVRAGTPWTYRSKTRGLRSAYATASRLAGVPLSVVRDRMGHESERTTSRHYLGRVAAQAVAGPFAGVPRLASTPNPGAAALPSVRRTPRERQRRRRVGAAVGIGDLNRNDVPGAVAHVAAQAPQGSTDVQPVSRSVTSMTPCPRHPPQVPSPVPLQFEHSRFILVRTSFRGRHPEHRGQG